MYTAEWYKTVHQVNANPLPLNVLFTIETVHVAYYS
jgi:hypothetical protein